MFKNKYLQSVLGVIFTASGACAQSDAFPVKSIRVIVPFAPGGSLDLISRMAAPRMGELLGQQIIVDKDRKSTRLNSSH